MIARSPILLGMAMILAFGIGASQAKENNTETYRQLNLFGDVFERVRASYVSDGDLPIIR